MDNLQLIDYTENESRMHLVKAGLATWILKKF